MIKEEGKEEIEGGKKERKKERLKEQNRVSNIYKEEECDVTLLW